MARHVHQPRINYLRCFPVAAENYMWPNPTTNREINDRHLARANPQGRESCGKSKPTACPRSVPIYRPSWPWHSSIEIMPMTTAIDSAIRRQYLTRSVSRLSARCCRRHASRSIWPCHFRSARLWSTCRCSLAFSAMRARSAMGSELATRCVMARFLRAIYRGPRERCHPDTSRSLASNSARGFFVFAAGLVRD